ncbi:phage tail sheath subtilisin-like domain-containing protein [Sphingomonas sp. HF-S4]|uniref:Phage tail sheath subtilisin-like domain-containing protein n=1 Tax=Sphingomonas agrestis TaxID=3080540 RepID=A0ABU3Y4J3_9SPHN|nr:phage tail sheath subtilisin-like domain-containing protein [Sphingomonas sp. HF-S4]MDV3456319.1 phage tail sheath subtilisin-like domain-containing protein [Sphingomonas sp. HF-S4]
MPEYLAPGVFVEEVSFRAKSIEGVSTTTTGFVGATRYGPIDIEPEIVTSLVEFERAYGGKSKLTFSDGGETDNYTWNAVRAFFEEGGKRCYVARAYTPSADTPWDGYAIADTATIEDGSPPDQLDFAVRARFPGQAGNGRVTFTLALGQNRLARNPDDTVSLKGTADRDVVWVGAPVNGFRLLLWDQLNRVWKLGEADDTLDSADEVGPLFPAPADPDDDDLDIRVVTVTVTVEPLTNDLPTFVATELPLDPLHERGGAPDSLFAYFAETPASLSRARTIPIVIGAYANNGLDVLDDLRDLHDLNVLTSPPEQLDTLLRDPESSNAARSVVVRLTGGHDGATPLPIAYAGETNATTNRSSGLVAFEALEDISIVAAPGGMVTETPRSRAIIANLIGHAERMKYRIAVIDSAKGQTISEVRALRALYDSSHAAFYYPWVRILDPLTGQENHYPPCGFVAGIYARNDTNRAVYKAPANEVVTLAIGFETLLNKAHQEVLNPEGINCFRFFEGRGMRLWGARTMSSDPEWKYVNLRRYFAYLERSIDKGTQWAVFEPNGERLWANVRSTIQDFLLNEWQNGALLGDKPDKAFFVKCDRSTMSQNDLDNGRLVCLVGVAPLRPAEFVIFRIGQWTADRKI